jgi:hypothetical protein
MVKDVTTTSGEVINHQLGVIRNLQEPVDNWLLLLPHIESKVSLQQAGKYLDFPNKTKQWMPDTGLVAVGSDTILFVRFYFL